MVCLVSQARVPIIKCIIDGVLFDLLFAAIEEPLKITKLLGPHGNEQASASDWFLKLSEMTQSSLYGRIGCDNLLSIVGKNNENAFKLTLKCVRFWAIRRGLYSVNCGYFSGVTLAVMVARVRQEFPDLQASCLLYKFFDRYAESGWREPVQINFRKKAQNLVASHLDALDRISKDVMVVLAPID